PLPRAARPRLTAPHNLPCLRERRPASVTCHGGTATSADAPRSLGVRMRHQASGITDVDIDESAASRRGTGTPARPAALMGVAFVTAAAALALLAFQILTSLADHASGDASLTFPVRGWLESIGAGVETVSMSYVALTDTESRLHATADVLERAWPAALLV